MGTANAGGLIAGGLVTAWLAAGCTGPAPEDEEVTCGPGTVQQGNVCVVDDATTGTGPGPSSSSTSGGGSTTNGSGGSGGGGGGGSSTSAGGSGGGGAGGSSSGAGGSGDCNDEATQSCYGGPAGTQGVGVCHEGTQTCAHGEWGPCVGEVTPSAETCDGLDNNCDGQVDDGLGTLDCGVGQCANTAPACAGGQPGTCTPGAPSPEACDGLDNNCDGQVDDGNPGGDQACITGVPGACAAGQTACVAGVLACDQTSGPSPESCNGIDDDCNGGVDDGCSPGMASYETAPGYFDAVLDTERHQVFLSYGGSGIVHVIDLPGGSDTVVTTGWKAEHMHFDPILDQVVISLPSGTHSAYWWDEDQEGYVGAIDAISLADPTPIWIPLDPWQIVSDGTGHVYAAGGSGQWTHAIAVNLQTGWSTLSSGQSVRNLTSIRIHPTLNRIYGADTGLSPSDIERWNIAAGTVLPSYDSPYHGTYPMCGDLRIHPAGNTIYTKCGHIFLASNVQGTDMTWVGNMGITWKDLAFHPSGAAVYVINNNAPTLFEYDATTLMPVATHPLSAPAQRILAGPTYLVVIRNILGGNPQTQVEVIPYADL